MKTVRSAIALIVCAAIAGAAAAQSADDIAFVSIRSGDAHVYVQRGGVDRVLTQGKSVNTQPAWSSGARIAFTSSRNGLPRIDSMHEDGSQQRRPTTDERIETSPSWSPDGKSLAFFSSAMDTGVSELRIVEVDSGRTVVVPGHGGDKAGIATWSADGKRLAFNGRDDNNRLQAWAVNSDGSGLRNLSANTGPRRPRLGLDRARWPARGLRCRRSHRQGRVPRRHRQRRAQGHHVEQRVLRVAALVARRATAAGRQQSRRSGRRPQRHLRDECRRQRDAQRARHPGEDFEGQWSADGKSVLFQSLRTGTSQLFRVDLVSARTIRLSNHSSHDMEAVPRPGVQAAAH